MCVRVCVRACVCVCVCVRAAESCVQEFGKYVCVRMDANELVKIVDGENCKMTGKFKQATTVCHFGTPQQTTVY